MPCRGAMPRARRSFNETFFISIFNSFHFGCFDLRWRSTNRRHDVDFFCAKTRAKENLREHWDGCLRFQFGLTVGGGHYFIYIFLIVIDRPMYLVLVSCNESSKKMSKRNVIADYVIYVVDQL